MAEVQELRLVVSVDKDTNQLSVLSTELNNVDQAQAKVGKGFSEGSKHAKDFTGRAIGIKEAMKVLVPVFGATMITKFFIDAAKEAARFDKDSQKALKNSAIMWDNLKVQIGNGFLPVIKIIPGIIQGIVISFGKLRQIIEQTMAVFASVISKNINLKDEIAEINKKYDDFLKSTLDTSKSVSAETEKANQKLTDKIKELTLSRADYQRYVLQQEIKDAEEAGANREIIEQYKADKLKQIAEDEANASADYKAKAEEKIKAEIDKSLETQKQSRDAAQQIIDFMAEEGLARELARIDKETTAALEKNSKLLGTDKNYSDQSVQINTTANKKKQKAQEEALNNKYQLEKHTGQLVDILSESGADNQIAMMWNIVKAESTGYAKRMALAAALALAQGNFAQAAVAASQVAIAIGVSQYAGAEAEKTRRGAEERRMRREAELQAQADAEQRQKEAANEEKKIEDNKATYLHEQGRMSTSDYITFLKKKQEAFRQYTDDWMNLQNQINSLEAERTSEIDRQASAASSLRGEVRGMSVNTEQKQVTNNITINVEARPLDIRNVDPAWMTELATEVAKHVAAQTTGRQ
jgi:hypothetical protein